jgi:hypothetical protein
MSWARVQLEGSPYPQKERATRWKAYEREVEQGEEQEIRVSVSLGSKLIVETQFDSIPLPLSVVPLSNTIAPPVGLFLSSNCRAQGSRRPATDLSPNTPARLRQTFLLLAAFFPVYLASPPATPLSSPGVGPIFSCLSPRPSAYPESPNRTRIHASLDSIQIQIRFPCTCRSRFLVPLPIALHIVLFDVNIDTCSTMPRFLEP